MKRLLKKILLITILIPLNGFAYPKVFINQLENKTPFKIGFYSRHYARHTGIKNIADAILNPGEKKSLNIEITLLSAANPKSIETSKYESYIFQEPENPENPNKLKLYGEYDHLNRMFSFKGYATLLPNVFSLSPFELVFQRHENIDDSIILINVIAEGENFEKSQISYIKKLNPKSLHAQSIRALTKQIKEKKITLEQAKKILPVDLHEELENQL